MERFYIWGQGVNERKVHLQKIVSLIFVHFCVHIVGSLFLVNSIRQTVLDEFASNNNNFKLSRPYYVGTDFIRSLQLYTITCTYLGNRASKLYTGVQLKS